MAQWYEFKLVFLEPPKKSALEQLNEELKEEDYDFSVISNSVTEVRWRSPSLTDSELRDFLVKHGLEAKFQLYPEPWSEEDDFPDRPWTYTSELARSKELARSLSLEDQKKLSTWLKKVVAKS